MSPPSPSLPQEPPAPAVSLRGVRKSFAEGAGERSVLADLDLEVPQGEFLVLLGRSGSGKSTLLNLIAGLELPDSGSVHVAGTEMGAASELERTMVRRLHLGMVFQFFHLVPTLTVEENLLLPLELARWQPRRARERAHELLAEVELADRAGSYPDRLSGGERQRIAVARALAHEPALILADEPTGNLDDENAARVVELLERLLRPAGRTLVFVTHQPEVLAADRVLRLEHGTLVPA